MKKRIFAVVLMVVALFTCLLPFSAFAEGESIDLVPHSKFYLRSGIDETGYTFGNLVSISTTGAGSQGYFPSPFTVKMNTVSPVDLSVIEKGSKLSFSFVITVYSKTMTDDSSPDNGFRLKYIFEPNNDNLVVKLGNQELVLGKDYFYEYYTEFESYPLMYDLTYMDAGYFRVYGEVDVSSINASNNVLSVDLLDYDAVNISGIIPFYFAAEYAELSIDPPPPPNPTQTLMQNLSTFGGGILGVWQVVVNFVTATGNEIALISVFAWLFVLGVGAIRRQITGV